ncbi:MAG: class I SAM-dependent methyltransferase [Ignavibacteriae bacterium HGW-Ignavibacteriae-2]|jgi:2-polyprenyl-3-methyl-5-hydroxy-6-metoxy-1,4-benzoquinol methylase|nr:MAG: class I SAM-dependent methyltransferase [Ignavibacteriae bacterium HGW-Ignavibacteriae-2]
MNKSEKFWDKVSSKFDKRSQKFDKTEIRTLVNTKQYLNVSDIVLDYGCATGTMAIKISDKVKKIYGIDISCKMIDAAKRKVAERKIENIDFAQSTIFDERYKRESFDVILALNILHFIEDPKKVMTRINELLKPGGLIISVTPCLGEKKSLLNILLFLLVFLQTKMGIVPYIRFFKISELEDSLTNGNLQILETESLHSTAEQYFIVAKKI